MLQRISTVGYLLICTVGNVTASTFRNNQSVSLCPNVVRCQESVQCHACLDAILPYATKAGLPLFNKLNETTMCSTDTFSSELLLLAMQEMHHIYPGSCPGVPATETAACAQYTYLCFSDSACRPCLLALHVPGVRKIDIMASQQCRVAEMTHPWKYLSNHCRKKMIFPDCSVAKWKCSQSKKCSRCWLDLRSSDSSSIIDSVVKDCNTNITNSSDLDNLVESCVEDDLGCRYWTKRCENDEICGACVTEIGNASSPDNIITAMNTAVCAPARHDRALLTRYSDCNFDACLSSILKCAINSPVCGLCLNDTASSTSDTECAHLLTTFDIDKTCALCPSKVTEINSVVIATSVVGMVSMLLCFGCIAAIIALGLERVSIRNRIIAGLLISNAIYSCANVVPLNLLQADSANCGQLYLSFDAIRFWRAWWFAGKFALIAFEIVTLGTSTWALTAGGHTLAPRVETVMHMTCYITGIAAFILFYITCSKINIEGYNEIVQSETYDNNFNHIFADDDIDDANPARAATSQFEVSRTAYDALVQRMLKVWVGMLGFALLQWTHFHWKLYRTSKTWHEMRAKVDVNESLDDWASTRHSSWQARREMLILDRECYLQIAKPLAPYVYVNIIFGIPATVMATDYCLQMSDVHSSGTAYTGRTELIYGLCDVYCELTLAFRSLVTVLYFLIQESNYAKLIKKLKRFEFSTKLRFRWQKERNPESDLQSVPSAQSITCNHSDTSTVFYEVIQIKESEIELVQQIASGACSSVHKGKWRGREVAVKVLLGGQTDDDGDPVNPEAEKEMQRECELLQRVKHPNVLRIFGMGVLSSGAGFIMTELASYGALSDVLLDGLFPLSWETRLSIALQISQGMTYLHSILIIHRDLKSANILLADEYRAVVADFGSGTISRQRRPVLAFSAFTGISKKVTCASLSISLMRSESGMYAQGRLQKPQRKLRKELVTVGIIDSKGNLSKALGTLLWMAPEIFRGDTEYSSAVDVYSFGIMLWELACREVPWTELGDDLDEAELFDKIELALKMGRRPTVSKPIFTKHPDFVEVMQTCWNGDPVNRPTFAEIATALSKLLRNRSNSLWQRNNWQLPLAASTANTQISTPKRIAVRAPYPTP